MCHMYTVFGLIISYYSLVLIVSYVYQKSFISLVCSHLIGIFIYFPLSLYFYRVVVHRKQRNIMYSLCV